MVYFPDAETMLPSVHEARVASCSLAVAVLSAELLGERNIVPSNGENPPVTRWNANRFAYVAFAFNGLCLLVLMANLLGGNTWWKIAVPLAIACLVVGAAAGVQARRLRFKERR